MCVTIPGVFKGVIKRPQDLFSIFIPKTLHTNVNFKTKSSTCQKQCKIQWTVEWHAKKSKQTHLTRWIFSALVLCVPKRQNGKKRKEVNIKRMSSTHHHWQLLLPVCRLCRRVMENLIENQIQFISFFYAYTQQTPYCRSIWCPLDGTVYMYKDTHRHITTKNCLHLFFFHFSVFHVRRPRRKV